MTEQVSQDTLQHLYDLLDSKGLRASDLIRELAREGKKLGHLGQLTEFEARRLIAEANKPNVSGPTREQLIQE